MVRINAAMNEVAKRHRFLPGQSGNPSGRPKSDATISALAKEHTSDALRTLVEITQNKKAPPSSRVHAASALLDRAWGKPAQYVENLNLGMTYLDFLSSLSEPTPEELDEVGAIILEVIPNQDEKDLEGL